MIIHQNRPVPQPEHSTTRIYENLEPVGARSGLPAVTRLTPRTGLD